MRVNLTDAAGAKRDGAGYAATRAFGERLAVPRVTG